MNKTVSPELRTHAAARAGVGFRRRAVLFMALLIGLSPAGCALGPKILHCNQRGYNEAVKCTDEEELLVNLVRLRYNDDIGLLNTTNITAQYELQGQANAVPFFTVGAGPLTRILPAAQVSGAGRPTFSLAPVMDSGVYRRLLRPLSNEDLIQLTETNWPASMIFRIWFQYANGVPNAVAAGGPTRATAPCGEEISPIDYEPFLIGMNLLQAMIDQGLCTFSTESKLVELGSPLPANSVTPGALLDAVRSGYEYRQQPDQSWRLVQARKSVVLKFSPEALAGPELHQFREIFHLKQDTLSYPLRLVSPEPPGLEQPPPEKAELELVPRAGIQIYYYLSRGVEVPPAHVTCGLAQPTIGPDGMVVPVTQGLFTVYACRQHCRPKNAHVAVKYHDYWFFIANDDAATKATFALVLLMGRIEFGLTANSPAPPGPLLTLPVGR